MDHHQAGLQPPVPATPKDWNLDCPIVYGPIPSRRFGFSLGINLLPSGVKICDFDCLYCQCGWTHRRRLSDMRTVPFPSLESLENETALHFQQLADNGVKPDTIVFSGNGEPLLHPDFDSAERIVRQNRDRFLPDAVLSILTNGSRLLDPAIRPAFERLELKCLKWDAGLNWLDRPFMTYNLEALIPVWSRLQNLTVQSFFCAGRFANTGRQWVEPWLADLAKIKPSRLQLYTVDRHAPVSQIEKASQETLLSIAAEVEKALGVEVQVFS